MVPIAETLDKPPIKYWYIMDVIDSEHLGVVRDLTERLADASIDWALTGSTSHALQGVPITPNDIDVQTSESGAFRIEERFSENVREPVSYVESQDIKSYLGELEIDGIRVEIIGDIQKQQEEGGWEPPVNVADHRTFVQVNDLRVPVLMLGYEAKAYERLGREERATLLREYLD